MIYRTFLNLGVPGSLGMLCSGQHATFGFNLSQAARLPATDKTEQSMQGSKPPFFGHGNEMSEESKRALEETLGWKTLLNARTITI